MVSKICFNCEHSFISDDGKLFCDINGLPTKRLYSCNCFVYLCPSNMFPLCSSSECLECPLFYKDIKKCKIGGNNEKNN